MRSISRVPRCQQRNINRLRRSSRPPLDRVDPVIVDSNPNAKSPDVPGGVDITSVLANVSSCSPYKFTTQPVPCVRASTTYWEVNLSAAVVGSLSPCGRGLG